MSVREQASELLEKVPTYKMGYVVAFLQGIMADDEAEDDLFCEQLYQNYLNDPDPEKEELVPLDECLKDWGVA